MREFHLGDILSVTTGRLVSPRHIDGVYDILNYMTGENLYTHQLPRATEACAGPLLAQHPDLADARIPEGGFGDDKANVEAWLADQVRRFGETRSIAPLSAGEYVSKNAYVELQEMMGL
jgi:hypothetical protein